MSWIDGRTPSVPESFRGVLSDAGIEAGEPAALADVALARLWEAIDRPGRDRAAAFHLLAADAYATYACEVAVEGESVRATLLELLETLQGARKG